jgi:hypothetical protein
VPTSSKKARDLTEDAALQLEYQAPDDLEEFSDLRVTERASFNEVQPGTLDFVLTWSRQNMKKAKPEQAHHLSLCLYLEEDDEDDAGPSQWRRRRTPGRPRTSRRPTTTRAPTTTSSTSA